MPRLTSAERFCLRIGLKPEDHYVLPLMIGTHQALGGIIVPKDLADEDVPFIMSKLHALVDTLSAAP